MEVYDEFNYRNAKSVLKKEHPSLLEEIYSILDDPKNKLDLTSEGKQRQISKQLQNLFVDKSWEKEVSVYSIPELKYDLVKDKLPIEIEIGHKRLVYADFFEFLADYSNGHIKLGIMIVTGEPERFGHTWHNSLDSTKRKIKAIEKVFLVPLLAIAINP
ncbi:hypothetical protein AKJ63_00915 [candidate division MSBL1 archaeon SCGC-AAA259D18]|uniref:Uncharacterized protein n=1 Tax=candidate division MSBL1 archaeon SCGC-AAA259D18 TaxID=1698262 RepID=A0A133UC60_9EURY|nr:hypothetical protein AKJ63_00915 [candidate division MSBL1 archaeon SCGC-AAA259D18]